MTRAKWLAIGVAVLIASSFLMVLFLAYFGNSFSIPRPVRVACVGDSITESSGYPAKLQTLLGASYRVKNFGVSGSTVLHESGKPYMNQSAFQDALGFLPDVVVMMLGTNDASLNSYHYFGDFAPDYGKLIAEFQAITSKPNVFLVTPPPIFGNDLGLNNTILVTELIPRMEQVAKGRGLPTIDVYTALLNHSGYFPDGVHPSSKGAETIAREVSKSITLQRTP